MTIWGEAIRHLHSSASFLLTGLELQNHRTKGKYVRLYRRGGGQNPVAKPL